MKKIRIRAITEGRLATDRGLQFFVKHESEAAIHIDNYHPDGRFRVQTTLVKMPDGRLENSAGQRFEILKV